MVKIFFCSKESFWIFFFSNTDLDISILVFVFTLHRLWIILALFEDLNWADMFV